MTKEKKRRGRPAYEATDADRKLVRSLAGYGAPQEYIAARLGVHDQTLRKYFAEELANGSAEANSLVAESLFKQARNGQVSAAIFWLKTRAGWKETVVNEHSGPDGGPIETSDVSPVEKLTHFLNAKSSRSTRTDE